MAWSLSERDRPEPEPLDGKLFTKELNEFGEWFGNTWYGKRFNESQQRDRELKQKLINQGGPAAWGLKIQNTPNPIEQSILKGISNVTNVDERITTPLTYIGLGAGAKSLSNIKFPRTYSKLNQKRILPKEERRMINITKDVDEIFNQPSNVTAGLSKETIQHGISIAKTNHISFQKGIQAALLIEKGQRPDQPISPGSSDINDGDIDEVLSNPDVIYPPGSKGDYIQKNVQGMAVDRTPEVPMDIRMALSLEPGLRNGVFDEDLWRASGSNRPAMEIFQTLHRSGVNWNRYRARLMEPLMVRMGRYMEEMGIPESSIHLHHIFAVNISAPLFRGLRYESQEYDSLHRVLLEEGVRAGNTEANLMLANKPPHDLVHRFYRDVVGNEGQHFFTPERREIMMSGPDGRMQVAREYAKIVKESQIIVVQAQALYEGLYGSEATLPQDILDKLTEIPIGKDGMVNEYSLPELKQIIREIVEDPGGTSRLARSRMPEAKHRAFEALLRRLAKKEGISPEHAQTNLLGQSDDILEGLYLTENEELMEKYRQLVDEEGNLIEHLFPDD